MIIPEFIIQPFYNYIPIVLLYAEVHFRFKWCGSRYFIKEPEILSDIPIRIEPGKRLPVLMIIKDAHNFPIKLHKIEVSIYKNSKNIKSSHKIYDLTIKEHWWDDTIFMDVNNIRGNIKVNVKFYYKINDKVKICDIHNFPLCTHNKMETLISEYLYPNDGNVLYGDLHYHSNLTEDMVEFGAPLKATLEAAESMGLDFFCNTDHSYDLDDKPGSWVETDPQLKKWNDSRKEIDNLNAESTYSSFIIP